MNVHIGNSPVVCGSIRDSGVSAKNIVLMEDNLSSGPVLPINNPEFSDARKKFWVAQFGKSLDGQTIFDAFCQNAALFKKANCVYVWIGESLGEHLFFACVLALWRHFNIDFKKLRLILVSHDPVTGEKLPHLGYLAPQKYSQVFITARELLDLEITDVLSVWDVVTSSDPTDFSKYLHVPHSEFVECICSLKWKYPLVTNGLSKTDWILLGICSDFGPQSLQIFFEYHKRHMLDPDCLDQAAVSKRLEKMASTSLAFPLLQANGDFARPHRVEFSLTDFGKNVLTSQANFVVANGIDEWVGGVHLKTGNLVWMYDPEADSLVNN